MQRWILLLTLFCLVSCASPRPGCRTAGAQRCNGTQVETCDGTAWSARRDCAEAYGPDGAIAPMRCADDEGRATCEK